MSAGDPANKSLRSENKRGRSAAESYIIAAARAIGRQLKSRVIRKHTLLLTYMYVNECSHVNV